MTFLIVATLSASVAYFVFALVACLHDCLMVRYRRHITPAVELDFAALSAELNEEMEVFGAKLLPMAIAPVIDTRDFKTPLPTKIRELRDYIRANNLQSVVKEFTGKSVSSCTKDELIAAIV